MTCHNKNCLKPQVRVVFNHWEPGHDPNGIARQPASWDLDYPADPALDPADIDEIVVKAGDMSLYYAGITEAKCLGLASTGLVVPLAGADCTDLRTAVCEQQFCYTKAGDECVFPFTYKGVAHTRKKNGSFLYLTNFCNRPLSFVYRFFLILLD